MAAPRHAWSLALAALACSTVRPVEPLGAGQAMVGASLGGPMVHALGLAMPTPILTAGGAYGVGERWNATASLDATAGAYGVLHLEPGAAFFPVAGAGARPTLMLGGSLHLLTNFRDTRVAPAATAVASWRAGRRLGYAGADAALALGSPTRLVAGPLAGGELRLGRHVGLGLELKWLAPYYDVEPLAPDWISPAHHGYFSVLLGIHLYTAVAP
jgi:hypothetical protein